MDSGLIGSANPSLSLAVLTLSHDSQSKAPTLVDTLAPGPSLIDTTASTIRPIEPPVFAEYEEDNRSITTTATSMPEEDAIDPLHVCDLSEVSQPGRAFQCPYCMNLQSFKHHSSWKRHVYADLRAYLCTSTEHCDTAAFEDRATWIAHEVENHRREWFCRVCQFRTSSGPGSLADHLKDTHANILDDQEIRVMPSVSSNPMLEIDARQCLLCDWDPVLRRANPSIADHSSVMVPTERFMKHLGHHLEQLALFTLPRGELTSDTATHSQGSGGARRASQDSRSSLDISLPENPQQTLFPGTRGKAALLMSQPRLTQDILYKYDQDSEHNVKELVQNWSGKSDISAPSAAGTENRREDTSDSMERMDKEHDFRADKSKKPNPADLAALQSILNNVVALVSEQRRTWELGTKFSAILKQLAYILGYYLTLHIARTESLLATTNNMLLASIDGMFDNIVDQLDHNWPCEFTGHDGQECVNLKHNHLKGHQSNSGKVIGAGSYVSKYTPSEARNRFRSDVYSSLNMYRTSNVNVNLRQWLPQHSRYLSRYFEFATIEVFFSGTICLGCLSNPMEHMLPCGHRLCARCITDYGVPQPGSNVDLSYCPVEGRPFHGGITIDLQPPIRGIRVLSLDGGGVRATVQLEILHRIEMELNIPLQRFFDLIVGTNTGGVIALYLARGPTDGSLDACILDLAELCDQIFTPRASLTIPGLGSLANQTKYPTRPLIEGLRRIFGDDQLFDRSKAWQTPVKAAVTSFGTNGVEETGDGILLANYERHQPAKLKTWEAALATCSAPHFFKPFVHESSGRTFTDGALFANNPVQIADAERQLIWPQQRDEEPDLVLSIGTSCNRKRDQAPSRWQPTTSDPLNHWRLLNKINKMAKDHIRSFLNSQITWDEFLVNRNPVHDDMSRYIRINPDFEDDVIALDDIARVMPLRDRAGASARDMPELESIVQRLLASCFLFRVASRVKYGDKPSLQRVTGTIECRLHGPDLVALARHLRKTGGPPSTTKSFFLVGEVRNMHPVAIGSTMLESMARGQDFRMHVTISACNPAERTYIQVSFADDQVYPISGFPRHLYAEE